MHVCRVAIVDLFAAASAHVLEHLHLGGIPWGAYPQSYCHRGSFPTGHCRSQYATRFLSRSCQVPEVQRHNVKEFRNAGKEANKRVEWSAMFWQQKTQQRTLKLTSEANGCDPIPIPTSVAALWPVSIKMATTTPSHLAQEKEQAVAHILRQLNVVATSLQVLHITKSTFKDCLEIQRSCPKFVSWGYFVRSVSPLHQAGTQLPY